MCAIVCTIAKLEQILILCQAYCQTVVRHCCCCCTGRTLRPQYNTHTHTCNTGRRRSRHWSSSYTLCEHSLTDHYRRAGYYYHYYYYYYYHFFTIRIYLHTRTAHSDKLIVIGSLYHNNTVYMHLIVLSFVRSSLYCAGTLSPLVARVRRLRKSGA